MSNFIVNRYNALLMKGIGSILVNVTVDKAVHPVISTVNPECCNPPSHRAAPIQVHKPPVIDPLITKQLHASGCVAGDGQGVDNIYWGLL